MPIFEYRCTSCGDRFDILVSADHSPPPCPSCGAAKVERMLSAFAVGKASGARVAPGPCGSAACACRAQDRHS